MKNKLIKTLEEVDDLLRGITYWLLGGLVLGFIREGDFLRNEHDIDLGIREKDYDKLVKILIDRFGSKVQVSSEAVNNNVVLRPIDNTDIIRVIKFELNEIKVDIFIHWEKGDKIYFISKADETGYAYHVYPLKLYTSFKRIIFYSREYLIPNPPEKYLELEYGTWWIPRGNWNHSLNPPCIKRSLDEIC